VIFTQ